MARNISDLGVIPSPEARKNLMNLAQRMIRTFCVNISTSNGQSWTTPLFDSPNDCVKITTRKITEPGQPKSNMPKKVFPAKLYIQGEINIVCHEFAMHFRTCI